MTECVIVIWYCIDNRNGGIKCLCTQMVIVQIKLNVS